MTLPDVEQLAKVIDLCRKKGVKTFKMGELCLELGDEPVKKTKAPKASDNEPDPSGPYAGFPTGELTNEQLMYYSAGGAVGSEPWLNKGEQT